MARDIGSSAVSLTWGTVGAAIGTVVVPVPAVGMFIGGAVGATVGSFVGAELGDYNCQKPRAVVL